MSIKSNLKKEPTTITLFMVSILLVIVFLGVSLAFQKSGPSIRNGATEEEIDDYAYQLLEAKPEDSLGYQEAVKYYESQISAAQNSDQAFSLRLGLASFFGRTGDPVSGFGVLDEISTDSLSPEARYYLYATFAFLYTLEGDSETASSYYQRIADEGIYDYVAKVDAGEIDPNHPSEEVSNQENDKEACDEECNNEESYQDEDANL